MNHKAIKRLTASIMTLGASVGALQGQSSDALLNKLVDKGILTSEEASQLKKETDAGFDKAYKNKTGLPDWVTSLRVYGDIRLRYEYFHNDNDVPGETEPNKDRSRFRFRLRTGMTATLKDNFELGFRLASGEQNGSFGGDPISSNATMQDNGSKKYIWIDLAYGKWTPINTGPWLVSVTAGKIENPFVTEIAWDADYTPEGAALTAAYKINDAQSVKLSSGVFALDETNQGALASDDPMFWGVQLRHDGKWTPELVTSAGVGWYPLYNEESLGNSAVPNVQVGNTRYATSVPGDPSKSAGNLVNRYYPIVADLSVTYSFAKVPGYPGAFPIRVAGEYIENPGADTRNYGYWAGITFGKAAKKGTWEASYRFKRLEADAQYEEFVDSDFSAYYQTPPGGSTAASGMSPGVRAGTGIQGHIFRVAYAPADSFQIGVTYLLSELITSPVVDDGPKRAQSGAHRLQVDATWKF